MAETGLIFHDWLSWRPRGLLWPTSVQSFSTFAQHGTDQHRQFRSQDVTHWAWHMGGGWMWGGSDEAQSIATIRAAIERGVTLIDTAPVYGFGHSEEIVSKALAGGALRDKVCIATKVGLAWNASGAR
jgi:aryl-alcohol dehydrogenase-like predicted oxidoreductase